MQGKIKSVEELKAVVSGAKAEGKKVVFTNGCFDLLHRGHLHLLREAKKLGDILIVAINNDLSVKKLKGPKRPILPEADRAELIGALEMVDYVTLFHEADPYHLIKELQPNILVKGGDWTREKIIGREVVEKEGGRVVAVPYLDGYSTTQMIERMCRN
ncbi:MAG: D-glycero-beta-D-manno-heptose 1-phosphate adenylyltransferase [Deltaproteobacteria bacterium]|nr:MAG: D-glycero-beta-D-manno-heptose 1-phosphate adenylyltransferase [Deltaproteobacteria bacterium]